MSEVKVNKISPRTACGTVTLGDSGDTFTIPSGATITNAGTASGFGATGETSWDTTVKTTGTFTATAGVGYFLNTTGGTITVNLPVGAAGSSVAMTDYAATWQTNNVTVAANGTEKIGGVDADVTLSTEGQSVTFVYIDGTQGWVNVLDSTSNVRGTTYITATVSGSCNTLSTSGDYKIAEFKGPGTFCVSAGAGGLAVVDYMVVAGGGGGGGSSDGSIYGGAGGGAGGWRGSAGTTTGCYTAGPLAAGVATLPVSVQGYPITVGGGAPTTPATTPSQPNSRIGSNGSNSIFSTITSAGGGVGGSRHTNTGAPPSITISKGANGGSGGGSSEGESYAYLGGTGNIPVQSPAQGFNGGNAAPADCGPNQGVTGGGGATELGQRGPGTAGGDPGGAGGAGITSCISASPVAYAGGGGSGGIANGGNGGAGGTGNPAGVGGANSCGGGVAGGNAAVNTAGGGGGASGRTHTACGGGAGGSGGSGIVYIRYKFQN